jgi:hypothetical protein
MGWFIESINLKLAVAKAIWAGFSQKKHHSSDGAAELMIFHPD